MMWTMVSEIRYNRSRYHLAGDDFITLCGNKNMLVRDYVENVNGEIVKIGECRQHQGKVTNVCKKCLNALNKS